MSTWLIRALYNKRRDYFELVEELLKLVAAALTKQTSSINANQIPTLSTLSSSVLSCAIAECGIVFCFTVGITLGLWTTYLGSLGCLAETAAIKLAADIGARLAVYLRLETLISTTINNRNIYLSYDIRVTQSPA